MYSDSIQTQKHKHCVPISLCVAVQAFKLIEGELINDLYPFLSPIQKAHICYKESCCRCPGTPRAFIFHSQAST